MTDPVAAARSEPRTEEYLGTQRHANNPETRDLRVLNCTKCGDRHTVDVADIRAEAARLALEGVAERVRGLSDARGTDLPDTSPSTLRAYVSRAAVLALLSSTPASEDGS